MGCSLMAERLSFIPPGTHTHLRMLSSPHLAVGETRGMELKNFPGLSKKPAFVKKEGLQILKTPSEMCAKASSDVRTEVAGI